MPPVDTSNESETKEVAPQAALVILKDDMENHFSNLYHHGWLNRSSEASLYPLYNLIITLSCLNLWHPNERRVSLMSCPQPFFGEVPPPGAQGGDPSDRTSKEVPKQQKKNQRLFPSYQFPDFARLLIFADGDRSPTDLGLETHRDISEFLELKRLNCRGPWWSEEGKKTAKAAVRLSLPQVHDAAMAGFAYNPEWKTVYAILIIGVYFTQVCWEHRPPDHELKPLVKTNDPETVEQGAPYPELRERVLGDIEQYSTRELPYIHFYSEPVFTYNPRTPGLEATRPRMSLSSKFLCALSKPTSTRFPNLSPRSTIFESQTKKPPVMTRALRSEAETLVEDVLRLEPIERLENTARALGQRFSGDPAPTPTPPNSIAQERYKASVKNIKELPASNVKTRAQMREALFDKKKNKNEGDRDNQAQQ